MKPIHHMSALRVVLECLQPMAPCCSSCRTRVCIALPLQYPCGTTQAEDLALAFLLWPGFKKNLVVHHTKSSPFSDNPLTQQIIIAACHLVLAEDIYPETSCLTPKLCKKTFLCCVACSCPQSVNERCDCAPLAACKCSQESVIIAQGSSSAFLATKANMLLISHR